MLALPPHSRTMRVFVRNARDEELHRFRYNEAINSLELSVSMDTGFYAQSAIHAKQEKFMARVKREFRKGS